MKMNTTQPSTMFAYHIDLKRAMWRLDYLLEFMRRLKQWGFNSVVLEIEDKFRFSRHPSRLPHTRAVARVGTVVQGHRH